MGSFISLKNPQFRYVYNYKCSRANKYMVMYIRKNGLDMNRIGICVSKKVGNSVVRHRITRYVREIYRLHMPELKTGYDIVFVARTTAKERNYHEIESACLHLFKMHSLFDWKSDEVSNK